MSDFKAKMHQSFVGWGSAPDPAGGAYSAPPDPRLDFRGLLLREGRRGEERGEKGREGERKGRGEEGPPCSPVRPPATTF